MPRPEQRFLIALKSGHTHLIRNYNLKSEKPAGDSGFPLLAQYLDAVRVHVSIFRCDPEFAQPVHFHLICRQHELHEIYKMMVTLQMLFVLPSPHRGRSSRPELENVIPG